MKLVLIDSETMENENGSVYVGEAYSLEGYTVIVDKTMKDGAVVRKSVRARVNDRDRFLPEIYADYNWRTGEFQGMKIQTAAVGALSPSDFAEYLKDQQVALEAATLIERELI